MAKIDRKANYNEKREALNCNATFQWLRLRMYWNYWQQNSGPMYIFRTTNVTYGR